MSGGEIKLLRICFVLRVVCLAALSALGCNPAAASFIQQLDVGALRRAAEYCRGDVTRPMTLSADKKVLCFDGWVFSGSDLSLVNQLEQGGYVVVRSGGGDVATTIALATAFQSRHATIVIDDYCLRACASYLFIASADTVVLRGALVAWTYIRSGSNDCIEYLESQYVPPSSGPRCVDPQLDNRPEYLKIVHLKDAFYQERMVTPPFEEPPQSIIIRRILKRKLDLAIGALPEILWTWNPRYYANAIKTKISYEAYPQSQDDVDAIVERIHLPASVIHDP